MYYTKIREDEFWKRASNVSNPTIQGIYSDLDDLKVGEALTLTPDEWEPVGIATASTLAARYMARTDVVKSNKKILGRNFKENKLTKGYGFLRVE